MEIIIRLKTTYRPEIKSVVPSTAKKKLFYYMSAGLITDKIEVEQFPISTVLHYLLEIFGNCGITNIINLNKDKEDIYVDKKNDENDFRKVISDFIDQCSWMYSKFYTTLIFNLHKSEENRIFLLHISINREHIINEFPIQIRISSANKKNKKTKGENEPEVLRKFAQNILESIKKSMPFNEMKMDLYQVNNSIPHSLFEENVDNIPENEEPADNTNIQTSENFLFPLYGVTLGVTTLNELKKAGTRATGKDSSGETYKFYVINGMNFWYSGNIADSIYITYTDAMPESWKKIGFSWNISYNSWLKLLREKGCEIKIVQEPKVTIWDNHPSFDAQVSAFMKTSTITYKIELGFHYSRGTKSSSFGTLYNIRICVC